MVQEQRGPTEQAISWPPYGRWEESPDGKVALIGSRCKSCGETLFPERKVCPRCLGESLEEVRLEGPATLYSFTVVHQLPTGFTPPLTVGYGKFPEGVLVFAPIDADPDRLVSGTPLALHTGVTKSDESGQPVITYRFRPIPPSQEVEHA